MPLFPARRVAWLLPVLALALAACGDAAGGASTSDDDLPRVLATTSVLGDVLGDLLAPDDGEALASVEVLMPPGVDPHAYEPSAADALALREADLVVANGLGLEEAVLDAIEAAAEDDVRVLSLGEELDPQPFAIDHGDEDHGEEGDGDDEGHDDDAHDGGLDPHVWLDPVRVADAVVLVAEAFASIAPGTEAAVTDRAVALAAEWRALDDELRDTLAVVPESRRTLVTNHDAFGYFAARYGFEIAAVLVEAGAESATTGAFLDTVELLEERDVPVVFTDAGSSDRLARSLAEEVDGLRVVELFSGALGPPGSGADTLPGMLRTDAARIVDALR